MTSTDATFSEILKLLKPSIDRLNTPTQQQIKILFRKLRYQIQGKQENVKECDELLHILKERDEAVAKLAKQTHRLKDTERLLHECNMEYNELQEKYDAFVDSFDTRQCASSYDEATCIETEMWPLD